jgi:hypothetical protein
VRHEQIRIWCEDFKLFQFDAAGLRVAPLLQWLPSGNGLRESGWVIKEWLGLLLI